ncbi:MAG: PTS sugar transporter subunit IIB [Erysipelotrichaceae bacterium]
MILKLRIDDRLLHGQVAYSWKSALSYEAIVIASDEASSDELRKTTIKMCCPDGVKLAVRSISEAAKLLQNDKLKNMKVFVVCENPESVHRLLALLKEKPIINLGGLQSSVNRKKFAKAVYLSEDEISILDEIEKKGYKIEVQEVPNTNLISYKSLRDKL